jgi:signal transduction histidine kinase
VTLDDLRRNRNQLFWGLHTLGWSAYLITQYMGALLYEKPPEYIKVILVAAGSGFLLSAPLRYVYRWLWSKRPFVLIPFVLFAAWTTALAWRVVINTSYARFVEDWMAKEPWYSVFSGALSSTYLLVCWSGLYFGIKYYETLQKQREEALQASALAQEAQVKMLRYQLNPHFMFNTLNAISTLILDGQGKVANQAIGRLSDFLRYTLDQDPMKKVTLRQELDALNLYLGIEKLRFGDRLKLEFDVDERAESALVPSLLLQPLVENAMKYAIAPREQGGSVTVIVGIEGGTLRLAVADDGPGLAPALANGNGRGVGLRNTRERLMVLYGDAHSVEVVGKSPGLSVEMRLPLEA